MNPKLEVKEEPEVDLGKKKKTVSSPILTLIGKIVQKYESKKPKGEEGSIPRVCAVLQSRRDPAPAR